MGTSDSTTPEMDSPYRMDGGEPQMFGDDEMGYQLAYDWIIGIKKDVADELGQEIDGGEMLVVRVYDQDREPGILTYSVFVPREYTPAFGLETRTPEEEQDEIPIVEDVAVPYDVEIPEVHPPDVFVGVLADQFGDAHIMYDDVTVRDENGVRHHDYPTGV